MKYSSISCGLCIVVSLFWDGQALDGQPIHVPAAFPQVQNAPIPWCGTGRPKWKQGSGVRTSVLGCPIQGPPDIPAIRDACIPTADSPIVTLRLKIHVFAEDDGSNPSITQEQVDQQMEVLNADFLRWRIQFVHDTVFENSSRFLRLKIPYDTGWEEDVEAMLLTHADRPERQLNVYVSQVSAVTLVLGFVTYLPWEIDPTDPLYAAWIWAPYWNSEVVHHELGHALGLYHTFTGVQEVEACSECYESADGLNGDTAGDFCSDTPAQPLYWACSPPPGIDSCSNLPWPAEDVRNYMSYACKEEFTPQQAGRMHCWIKDRLSGWSVATLSLAMSATPEPAIVGSNLVYSITISNYGSAPVTEVLVTNSLPPDVCLIAVSSNVAYMQMGNTLALDFGTVTNGQSVTADLTVMPTRPGSYTNAARLPSGAISTPEHPTSAIVVSTVEPNPVISGPILVIEDARTTEGNSGAREMVFRVCLSPPADHPITFNYQTSDGTADAGIDYQSVAGQLTFMPGETSLPLPITIYGDAVREDDETFYVDISAVPDVFNAKLQAAGVILHDDAYVDLVISDLSVPDTGSTGGSLLVTNAIRNRDIERISATFSVGVYLSADPVITTNDFRIGGRRLRGLGAGMTDGATNEVSIPSSFQPGAYYLGVIADEGDVVGEVFETNNVSMSIPIQVILGPDLEVASVSGPLRAGTASIIRVTNTVRNSGTGNPGSFDAGIYLSPDALITTSDYLIGTRHMVGLSPESDATAVTEAFIPPWLPIGNYHVGCVADYQNFATEKNELNNSRAGNVIEVARGPDLIVLAVKSRNGATTGSGLFVTNIVHNLGMFGVPTPFSVGIYLSSDQYIDTNDIRVGLYSVPSLAAESSMTNVWTIFIDQRVPAGTYYLGAIVDPNGVAYETDNSNNSLASHLFPVTLGPDLVVTAVNGPSRAGRLTSISVTNGVRNIASGVASGVTVGLHLSADNNIDGNDFLLASRTTDITTFSDSVAVTAAVIPGDLPLGTYLFGAIVDVLGVTPELNEDNNVLLGHTIEIVPGPDLVIATLSAPATAVPGTSISIQNTVQNQGGDDVRSAFSVGLYLSTDDVITTNDLLVASRMIAGLGAGQSNSQVTTVTLSATLKSGSYYLGAIADSFGQAVETSESNNASLASAIAVNIGPDLVMRSLSGPTQAVTGQSIVINDSVENLGIGPAMPVNIMFVLSEDPEISTNDSPLTFRSIFALPPGQTSSGASAIVLNNNLASGTYYLGAIADYRGVVEEPDDANNVLLGPQIQIAIGPDIDLSALSGPARANAGRSITLSNTVRNLGAGGTPAFSVNLYLSADTEITTNDLLVGTRPFPNGLGAGASSSENTQVVLPIDLTGSFHFGAIADPGGLVVETSEANNRLVGGMIEILDGVDLVLTGLEAPGSAIIGAQVLISNAVHNAGQTDAGTFEVAFYLSTDAVISAEDALLGTRTIAGLSAQQTSTATTLLTINPLLRSGHYYVGALVNPSAGIGETTRTNNSREAIPILLEPGADLVVNSVSGPVSALTGQTIFLNDTISNAGLGQTRHFSVTFYLSTDDTITTNDLQIGSRTLFGGLAPAQINSGSFTPASLSTSLAPGNYFLGAIVDPSNVVEETNESNNARSGPAIELAAGSDLEVTLLSGPARAGAGSSILVNDTVRNSGSTPAPGFSVQFYLSLDEVSSTNDLVLASRLVPEGLGPGESRSATMSLALPIGLAAGDYWIGAKADAGEQIRERSELNNIRLYAVQVLGGPDLVLSALQGPGSGFCGGSMSVSITALNAGMFEVTSNFIIGIYLVPDLPVPSAELRVGQTSMSGLAAGEDRSVNVQVSLPCVLSGNYYVRAVIDEGRTVPEINEGNNTFTGNLIAMSAGVITAIQRIGADVDVSFTSVSGKAYRVERTSNLIAPWSIVPGAEYLIGNGATVQITDYGATSLGTAFYRTRLMP